MLIEVKQVLGIISIFVAIIAYIPYLRDTFNGRTKPHVISWFL